MRRSMLAGLCCLLLTASGWAQEAEPSPSPSPEAEVEDPFKFRGYWATSYESNFNQPSNGKNNLDQTHIRGYDFDANKLKLDILELDFQYGVDRPGWLGARLDVDGGSSMPFVDTAAGLFRNPYTLETNSKFDIRQVFLTYKFEGSNLRIDAGKFATFFGYEGMDGVDTTNPHGTRTYTYTYSPFTHTGVRVIYPVADWLTVTGEAVFGSDKWQDTTRSLALGGQLAFTPTDELSVTYNYLTGPELPGDSIDVRQLHDLVLNYKLTPENNLGLETITGVLHGAVQPNTVAHWNSLVLYSQNQITDQFWFNLRHEWFNDASGYLLGRPQHVRALTFTPEYRLTPDWIVRMDLRFDNSDQPVYDRRGRGVGWMNTVFFNHILKF